MNVNSIALFLSIYLKNIINALELGSQAPYGLVRKINKNVYIVSVLVTS